MFQLFPLNYNHHYIFSGALCCKCLWILQLQPRWGPLFLLTQIFGYPQPFVISWYKYWKLLARCLCRPNDSWPNQVAHEMSFKTVYLILLRLNLRKVLKALSRLNQVYEYLFHASCEEFRINSVSLSESSFNTEDCRVRYSQWGSCTFFLLSALFTSFFQWSPLTCERKSTYFVVDYFSNQLFINANWLFIPINKILRKIWTL